MTVASGNAKAGPYTGNDSASAFTFAFKVFADTDIRVVATVIATEVESDLVLNTDYTVARNADQDNDPGGTVTYKVGGATTAYPSTHKLTIVGNFVYEQPTDIPNGGAFFAQVLENAYDRLMLQIKQLKEQADRAVTVSVSSDTNPEDLVNSLLAASAAATTAAAEAAAAAADAAASAASAEASVATISALRGFNGAGPVDVLGYYVEGDGGGGPLRYLSSGEAPGTYTDNGGSIIVPTGGDGSAAWLWGTQEKVSVHWFGARGNGTDDDTAAIAAALADAPAGGVVTFGSHIYAANIVLPDKYVHLSGSGYGAYTGGTVIHGDGTIVLDTPTGGDSRFSTLSGITIQADAGNTGIRVRNFGLNMTKVFSFGGATAIEIQESVAGSYRDVTAYGSSFGLKIAPAGVQAVNLNTFENIATSSPTGTGIHIEGGASARNNVFINADAEQSVLGMYNAGLTNTFINFWEESCTTGVTETSGTYSIFQNRYLPDASTIDPTSLDLGLGEISNAGSRINVGAPDYFTDVAANAVGQIRMKGSAGSANVMLFDDDGTTFAAESGPYGVAFGGRVGAALRGVFVQERGVKANGVSGDYAGEKRLLVSSGAGVLTRVRTNTATAGVSHTPEYLGTTGRNYNARQATSKAVGASSAVDLFTAILDDKYGVVVATVEYGGVTRGGAALGCKVQRLVFMNGDSPTFTTIGTDYLLNCTIAFSYVANHGFKATLTNSVAVDVSGGTFVSISGGGDDAGGTSGILSLF